MSDRARRETLPRERRAVVWSGRMMVRGLVRRLLLSAVALLVASGCATAPGSIPAVATTALQVREQPAGKMVYVRDGDLWIWQGGEARQLTSGGTWRQPSFSPDGQEIAYVYRDQNFSDLFAMAADGSASRRLTRGQAQAVRENDWAFRPAWSPDGSQIAYISDANSFFPVVWIMNKDGSAKRQIMTFAMNVDAADAISWSPDGKRLAVTAFSREPGQIYVVDIARGTAERLTNHAQGAFDPAWSPDGKTIAYIGRDSGRGELWLRRVDGSPATRFDKLPYVRSPVWSPDGGALAVLSAESGAFEVWVASVEAQGDTLRLGEFRQLTRDGGIDAASGLSWVR